MAVPAVGPVLNKHPPSPSYPKPPILPNSIVAPYVLLFVDEVSCVREQNGARAARDRRSYSGITPPEEGERGLKKQQDGETSKWQSAQACV